MTNLTEEGFKDGYQYFAGPDGFKYETFPDYLKKKGLDKEMESKIPICADALPIWQAYHDFFADYVNLTMDKEVNIKFIIFPVVFLIFFHIL